MDVRSFTGPTTDKFSNPQIEDRNVHSVQHIVDRKESDTPASSYTPNSSLSLEVRDHPLQLVLRVVIDKLNETLPHNNEHTVFNGISELDLSPASTAKRIVTHATSLYEPYKLAYSEKHEAIIFQDFMDNLVKGIELGFDEAQEMLQNLGVLHGEIERDIDNTFSLVQQDLFNFRNSKKI